MRSIMKIDQEAAVVPKQELEGGDREDLISVFQNPKNRVLGDDALAMLQSLFHYDD